MILDLSESLQQLIKSIGDLERLVSKIAIAKINPREVLKIKDSLIAINDIKVKCSGVKISHLLKCLKD